MVVDFVDLGGFVPRARTNLICRFVLVSLPQVVDERRRHVDKRAKGVSGDIRLVPARGQAE